ncbi:MAG TPA: hypothetical protein P5102_05280 [Candidatus Competibacteraceae bacterium]|nr:hypothetical protein [Candidatus Competibacteraceae bacterium]
MSFKFRLVFFHQNPGFFRIDEKSIDYQVDSNIIITIVPRDANKLNEATKYHIESGGFTSIEEARSCGEKIRTSLRLLNCLFHLGLTIPIVDGISGSVSTAIKDKVRKDGGELIDTIVGLHVYPDDGVHFEHVASCKMNVYPSDPFYVLKSIKDTWSNNYNLNEQATDVIEILNISVRETSPKIKFLASYLAMEQIINREMRTKKAQQLIDEFICMANDSDILDSEKTSLIGALGHLKEQSFSSAFTSFARRITSPKTILNMPVVKFVSECIKIRNKIAHNVAIDKILELDNFTNNLRNMAMSILWSKNNFPEPLAYRPADQVEMQKFEVRFL